ncbi:MAG: SAM-dependent methyltransferase [Hyphomicrobiales bacterium]|nr:SAM-dependent methyltransferase [Hyphomicrobiales bacterium]
MAKTPVETNVLASIAANGPMCVSDYMAMCLTDLEHGYYRKAEAIGRQGDFITAPEISQIFGELIGLWAVQVWRDMGTPAPFQLIELGPGRGVLMADALRAAKSAPDFLSAMMLCLVESSLPMRERQETALRAHNPVWLDDLGQAPLAPSIIIANEFFDALSIRQFAFENGVWRRRRIDASGGALHFVVGEPEHGLSVPTPESDGAIFEDSPSREAVIDQFACLAAHSPFAAIVIDYGHQGEAGGDTLQAVSRHGYASVFDRPGETDLSSHIDFAALARRANQRGLLNFGPIPMGLFLLRLGMGVRLNQLCASTTLEQQEALIAGVRRLTSPMEMGELFRVLAVTNGVIPAPFEVTP